MSNAIILFVIFLLGVLIIYIIRRAMVPEDILDNWDFYFPDVQFSTLEFYDSVEAILQEREIPKAEYSRVEFSEYGSFFDQQRLYLRIQNYPYSFDICAAPYGKGFFVSWWFGEDIGLFRRLLCALPIIGRFFRRKKEKTYFMLDCESMFMQAIHEAVLDTIDDLSSEKGFRKLTELERRYNKFRRR